MGVYDNYSHEATELYFYALNDADLYRQQREPIEANLQKKYDADKYDEEKAVKLWGYFAVTAAKKYHHEFCGNGKWFDLFPPATRLEMAKLAEIDHRDLMKERAE